MHQVLYFPRDILIRAHRRRSLDYPTNKVLVQMMVQEKLDSVQRAKNIKEIAKRREKLTKKLSEVREYQTTQRKSIYDDVANPPGSSDNTFESESESEEETQPQLDADEDENAKFHSQNNVVVGGHSTSF